MKKQLINSASNFAEKTISQQDDFGGFRLYEVQGLHDGITAAFSRDRYIITEMDKEN